MRNVERAKKIATEKGINVSFVCREVGKSRGYISQMLVSGRDFPDEMLPSVANALGVTVAELRGEDSGQKEKPTPGEGSGLDEQAKSFAEKLMQLDEPMRTLFNSMLDAAIAEKLKKNG